MPNIVNVLKAEISRLARKEVREEVASLKKTVAAQRAENAALKRRLQDVEATIKQLTRINGRVTAAPAVEAADGTSDGSNGAHRFSAKGLAANRQRLELSAADFGRLIGVTGQSVYAWEAGKSRPRAGAIAAIAALRGLGKREAMARLEALKG